MEMAGYSEMLVKVYHTVFPHVPEDNDDDDDDDCIWVWDLTAPMHLGLINGPFVPHIKIKGAL